ncbi:uncharacterized protein BP5553_04235 [Venustampulla echinocandica]|uniref:Phosphoglycerate mutase-like protein n=1 Tax=Venustampulla echinocandica TaxID=2656787 RepID=A0A370TWJ2_9HELO|nr:uncharacterized protein BP5553_04235 [Venustampulla echinocandica]RDL39895.1 hypothetical protein BP5553_04235 [Venustampulla echinocandica]
MVLHTIYLTRHGFRANWSSEPPKAHSSGRIPPDTPLSTYGEQQAQELAAHLLQVDPRPDIIYSSPFYRCIQTVQPSIDSYAARSDDDGQICGISIPIHGEPGLGEWYGASRTSDPQPAPPKTLQSYFTNFSLDYEPIWTPSPAGETILELHERAAFTLACMIRDLDTHPDGPKCVLICTHAATFMAVSRALTGFFPEDITVQDFHPWTAGLSKFVRRDVGESTAQRVKNENDELPKVDWKGGKGVGGGWDCVVDGDCTFLSGGEERGWRFSGRESFSHAVTAHGVDAGTGLGIVTEIGNKSLGKDHSRTG